MATEASRVHWPEEEGFQEPLKKEREVIVPQVHSNLIRGMRQVNQGAGEAGRSVLEPLDAGFPNEDLCRFPVVFCAS